MREIINDMLLTLSIMLLIISTTTMVMYEFKIFFALVSMMISTIVIVREAKDD